ALLTVLNPSGEKEPLGYASLAPVDDFMERHRIAIIIGTAVVSLGGLPLLYFLQFDFNPINLRSTKVESIATYLDLRSDPETGGGGGHASGGGPRHACRGRPGGPRPGAGGVRNAAQGRIRRLARLAAGRGGHPRQPAGAGEG